MPSIYYIKLFRELYFILIPASALVYASTCHGCRSIYTTNLFVIAPTLAPAPPLLELELNQTVAAPQKMGVELGKTLTK